MSAIAVECIRMTRDMQDLESIKVCTLQVWHRPNRLSGGLATSEDDDADERWALMSRFRITRLLRTRAREGSLRNEAPAPLWQLVGTRHDPLLKER